MNVKKDKDNKLHVVKTEFDKKVKTTIKLPPERLEQIRKDIENTVNKAIQKKS